MKTILAFIFLSFASSLLAQSAENAGDISQIHMKADRSIFLQSTHQTKLIGHAEIYGNNLHLFADEIIIQLTPPPLDGSAQSLQTVWALGHVLAQAEGQSIEADEMHYDHEQQIAVFSGHARVFQAGGEATAEQVILNVQDESFELVGAVHGILEGL